MSGIPLSCQYRPTDALHGPNINDLPQEVLVMIMSNLSLFHRKRMRLVCKYWNETSYERSLISHDRISVPTLKDLALLADGPIYRKFVNLRIKKVDDEYVESGFWHKFGSSISEVDVMGIQNKTNPVFIDIFKHCGELKVLRLFMDLYQESISSPEENSFSDLIPNASLTSIHVTNSDGFSLTDAELIALTQTSMRLTEIELNIHSRVGESRLKYSTVFSVLNSHSKAVTHLKLTDIGELDDKLSDLLSCIGNQLISLKIVLCTLTDGTLNKICELFPNLKVIELSYSLFDEDELKHVFLSCNKLETVLLRQTNFSNFALRDISHLSNLKQIDLSASSHLTGKGLIAAFTKKTMPTLETFNLSFLDCVSDKVIVAIAPMVPNLICWDLRETKVGDLGAKSIFTHNKRLRSLSLVGCQKLKNIFTGTPSINELRDLTELNVDYCFEIDATSLMNLRLKHLRKLRANAVGLEGLGLSAAIETFISSLNHLPCPWPKSFLAAFFDGCPSLESVDIPLVLDPANIEKLGLTPHAVELLSASDENTW